MKNREFKENVNTVEAMHVVARITDKILMAELKKYDLGSDFIVDYLYEIEEAYLDEDYDCAFNMFINMVGVINKDLEMLLKLVVRVDEENIICFLDYYLNYILDSYQVDALYSSCDDCYLNGCCEAIFKYDCEDDYESLYDDDEYLNEEYLDEEEISISLNLSKLLEAVEDLINNAVKEVINYERNKGDCYM